MNGRSKCMDAPVDKTIRWVMQQTRQDNKTTNKVNSRFFLNKLANTSEYSTKTNFEDYII
jgi:hypothetical protein